MRVVERDRSLKDIETAITLLAMGMKGSNELTQFERDKIEVVMMNVYRDFNGLTPEEFEEEFSDYMKPSPNITRREPHYFPLPDGIEEDAVE